MKEHRSEKSQGIVELNLDCENRQIQFPIALSRMAIWERYIPYVSNSNFFKTIKSIFNEDKDNYVNNKGLLSNKFRMESLHNNLSTIIKLRESQMEDEIRVVECGTGGFVSTKIIARLISDSKIKDKFFCAYDTFEGLPKSGSNDYIDKVGLFNHSIEEFYKIFNKYDFVVPVKGKIPDSLPSNDKRLYDFVHIDLDLYEGTSYSLIHFFKRLKKRGIIQLDDYNNTPWFGVNKAVNEFLYSIPQEHYMLNEIPLGGAFILKL